MIRARTRKEIRREQFNPVFGLFVRFETSFEKISRMLW